MGIARELIVWFAGARLLSRRVCAFGLALALGLGCAGWALAFEDGSGEGIVVLRVGEVSGGVAELSEPEGITEWLRAARGGRSGVSGGAEGLLRAGRAAAELVERAPASVLVVSEALRAVGREEGFRPHDAATALDEAGVGSVWLQAMVRVGASFERDRSAFLHAVTVIDDEGARDDQQVAAWIVRARMLLAMGRDDDALAATQRIVYARDGAIDPWALDARLRMLGLLGEDGRLLDLALRALPAERPEVGDAVVAERLSLAGEAAYRLNDRSLALLLLGAARDLQPGRLSRHERLVMLLLEEPEAVERATLRSPLGRALRELRLHHADAALLDLVLVWEAVRREQPALVVRSLERLAERFPDDERVRSELVGRWLDIGEVGRARAMIEGRLEVTPPAARAVDMVLYGRILAAEELPDRAIQRLGTWIDEQGDDPRVLAELERLYRTGVYLHAEAERMRLRRLALLPRTIGHEIERAVGASAARERVEAFVALRSAFLRMGVIELETPARGWLGGLPGRVEPALLSRQREDVTGLLRSMMDRNGESVPAAEVVAMFDAGDRVLAPLPEDLAEYWVLMKLVSGGGLEGAIETAERAGSDSRETRRSVFLALLNEMGLGGRLNNAFVAELRDDPRSGMEVARRAALGGGGDDPEMFTAWLLTGHMATARGPIDERQIEVRRGLAECVIEADRAGLLRAAIGGAGRALQTLSSADLCAELAAAVDPDRHWEAAVLLYRQGLVLEPGHAGLNNSYGYRLLERDEDIVRAEAMIERAVRADPRAPEYLDSLGWARYKRGMLHDEPPVGPLGEGKEGAITLLERAIGMLDQLEAVDDGDPDETNIQFSKPTVLDHAGDAHWAAGNRELAMERWMAAGRYAALVTAWIERRNLGALMESAWITREVDRVAASTRAKLDAARSGEAVPIARMPGVDAEADGVSSGAGEGAGG